MRWKWVLALTVVIATILGVLQLIGALGTWYEWVWQHTTGRPYTYIMRDNPWLLLIPSTGVIAGLARVLPTRYWARVVLIDVVLVVGFLAGHVFW
ncbi:hypothetical protein LCGC14_3076730, partial [marine sediment metagenome]